MAHSSPSDFYSVRGLFEIANTMTGFLKRISSLVALGAAGLLLSCAGLHRMPTIRMRMHVEQRANQDQPIAFDLVAVRNKALSAELMKMTAGQWFAQRDQIREDFPKHAELEIRSWEWVPGQAVGELPVKLRMKAKEAFVFAKYAAGGEGRARLDVGEPVTIVLGERKMAVAAGGGHKKLAKRER